MRVLRFWPCEWRLRRPLLLVLPVVLLGLAASTVLAGEDDGAAPSLGAGDIDSIGSLVETWIEGRMAPWPAAPSDMELDAAAASSLNETYATVVGEVGTLEFVKRHATFDLAAYEQYLRHEAPDTVFIAHEAQVLSIEPLLTQEDGDVVVKVMVWEGWTAGGVDVKSGEVVDTNKIDQTPVHVYAIRKTDVGWRLAAEYGYYQRSADGDMMKYGPDTPHKVLPPTSEWRLD